MRLIHLSTIFVLSLLFTLVFSLCLVTMNVRKSLQSRIQQKNWTLELSSLNPDQIQSLKDKIQAYPAVVSIQYVSQQQSIESFKSSWASLAPDLLKDPAVLQSIPESFEIQVQTEQADKVKTDLLSNEGVLSIDTGDEWDQKYLQVAHQLNQFSQVILAVFALGSLFIFSYVIQGSVQAKQKEIEVLELIGATNLDIRKPFLLEGFLLGLASGVLALAWTYFILSRVQSFGSSTPLWNNWISDLQFFPPIESFILVLLTSTLGALASYFFVRKMNTGWSFHRKSSALR